MKYHVSFRIGGDELDPLEITEILGIVPDLAHKKGDKNTTVSKKGKIIEFSPFSCGLWSIKSKNDEYADLEYHIKSLLILLYPLKDRLIELSNRGYKMDMFCGVFVHEVHQAGFSLSPDTLLKLGELSTELGICIY